jgi:1-deoxy-D-xylulose-5-phosphate reductoisomerase
LKRRVAILGSTGSIGTNALDVIARHGDRLEARILTTHARVDVLIDQARRFRPAAVVITSREPDAAERAALAELGVDVLVGVEALVQVCQREDVEVVLLAVVGAAGLPAAIATVDAGKTLALANKESLVVGGSVVMPLARQRGASVIPVDSEHSALFQAMQAGRRSEVRRVILTASGGPFLATPIDLMRSATPAEALNHPKWHMGAKVTIDSATMFNKSLEIIEAHWLFDLPSQQIDVVVHPEAVVHSMVEFVDGSVIAQLSPPDMRTPIQLALTWPERLEGLAPRLDITRALALNFEPPDERKFPSLAMGHAVVQQGGTSGAVFNAANEVAVSEFLRGTIRLGVIFDVVRHTMNDHVIEPAASLDALMRADAWARRQALQWVGRLAEIKDIA